MNITTKKDRLKWFFVYILLVIAAFAVLISIPNISPIRVSAHSGDVFGSACGMATIDGNVGSVEWSNASTRTFQMVSPGGAPPFTVTLHIMNSGYYLYMGITINDDEFSKIGDYLPQGDAFIINFDNNHSGSLYQMDNAVLALSAGFPQFEDRYVYNLSGSNMADINGGGTADGVGATSRVNNLNHFEVKHPLCSGDSLDFCLHPSDIVGFRLRYLDAEANGSFGSAQYYPGSSETSEADIMIGTCSVSDIFVYLPLIQK